MGYGGKVAEQQRARGYAYKEVASRLYLSVKTIETHVSAVLRKL
jgi:DNA-binding NarL/FixJ family response regulator